MIINVSEAIIQSYIYIGKPLANSITVDIQYMHTV